MSCLCCAAAFLAWVGLAVISFTMRLSVEFVNNLVAVLNVLAPQVATALDTLSFALASERNPQSFHGIPGMDYALASSRSASRPIGLAPPTCIRTRPMDTSSTWYIPALSPPRDAHRDATEGNPGHRPETMLDRLPPPRPLAPHLPRSDQDKHRLPRLIRIRMVQCVHTQVLHRSVHLLRWFMDLAKLRNCLCHGGSVS